MKPLSLENYKKLLMKTAEDLHYGKDVIKQIRQAESEDEIEHIMASARKRS